MNSKEFVMIDQIPVEINDEKNLLELIRKAEGHVVRKKVAGDGRAHADLALRLSVRRGRGGRGHGAGAQGATRRGRDQGAGGLHRGVSLTADLIAQGFRGQYISLSASCSGQFVKASRVLSFHTINAQGDGLRWSQMEAQRPRAALHARHIFDPSGAI